MAKCINCGDKEIPANAARIEGHEDYCTDCYNEARLETDIEARTDEARNVVHLLKHLSDDKAGRAALVRAIAGEHRTNQQLVCGGIIAILEHWASMHEKGPGYFDARNEATVKFASIAITAAEKFKYLPYI